MNVSGMRKMVKQLSFRQRQFLILLMQSIMIIVVFIALALPSIRSLLMQQTFEFLEIIADLKSAEVYHWLHQGTEITEIVALDRDVQKDLETLLTSSDMESITQAQDELWSALEVMNSIHHHAFVLLLLHPSEGTVLQATDPFELGREYSGKELFIEGQTAYYVSSVGYYHEDKKLALTVSAPIRDIQNELLGVIVAEMDVTELEETLNSSVGFKGPGSAFLVDSQGHYVTLPPYVEREQNTIKAESYGVNQALAKQDGNGRYVDYRGVKVLGVYRWLPEAKMALIIEMEEALLFQRIIQIWTLLFISMIGLLAISILAARYLTNWFVTPLEKIVEAAHALRSGDLSHRAPPSGRDEIGQLSKAFNEMAANLERAQDDLEQLVARRTMELTKTNEQLTSEIARRNLVEQNLMISEEWFRALFEGAPDAVFLADPVTGEILDANPAASKLLMKPTEDIIGLCQSQLHPSNKDASSGNSFKEYVQRSQELGDIHLTEASVLRADGCEVPVEIIAQRIHILGKSFLQSVFRDITERKNAHMELHKTNLRLESAMSELKSTQEKVITQERLAAVGQLAAGIAHDFNNALVPITLYSQALRWEDQLSPEGMNKLAIIHDQAQHAASLTQQILDFSRQSLINVQELKLSNFLGELVEVFKRTLPETVRIHFNPDDGEYKISADPSRMRQAFMNLAINANDAMPEGGELSLELSRIVLNPDEPAPFPQMPPGEWVRINISDSGEGIHSEILPHIFEPFFTTKEVGKGSGLGLAQVFGIVTQHDGFIDVQSIIGEGTTFSLYFPELRGKHSEVHTPQMPMSIEGAQETILLVEDNQVVRNAVCDTLEMLGFRVLTSENGNEALESFKRNEVKLVLSDMVMPGMGGMELFRELKSIQPDVKIILMSGYPLGGDESALADRGITTWIQKPLNVEKIMSAIQSVIDMDLPERKKGE